MSYKTLKKSILKRSLLLITFLFFKTLSFSQTANSTNYISYIANTPITFTLGSTTALESATTVSDAFCLSIDTKAEGAHIYVSATSSTTTTTPMPVSDMSLIFYSTTAPSADYTSLNTSAIPLSSANQLLVMPKTHNGALSYCYSVAIPAIGYNYLPGTYTFTIHFTMTEP